MASRTAKKIEQVDGGWYDKDDFYWMPNGGKVKI